MNRHPQAAVFLIFAAAALLLASPWLAGVVTVPWDAKAQFFPAQAFLARSLAAGEWPFWTPSVFAGWPQIADPQSLVFSPPHVLLALLQPAASFRGTDAAAFAVLAGGSFGILMIFRDRGWHAAGALVAALAFMFGGACASRIQHTGQVLSAAYFALALWLLLRALERASAFYGVLAGIAVGLIALSRDQVGLLALYLLALIVAGYWLDGEGRRRRFRESLKPLTACGFVATALALVPVAMTLMLTAGSNRPAIAFAEAARGSLHPAHLLTLAFADLYGAADPAIPYWGPASFPWGETGLVLAQNMGQLYAGALPFVALIALAMTGPTLWAREIRWLTIACVAALLYTLGWYTPAFWVFYEALPGVAFFRRPADAAFLFGALFAILGGYAVHQLLALPAPTFRRVGTAAFVAILALISAALAVAVTAGMLRAALLPTATGAAFLLAALATLWFARRFSPSPLLAAALLAAFMAADLSFNNAPNESTGLPPSTYEALRPQTADETVALLKSLIVTEGARRDRVELSAITYHWPNLSLVHGFEGLFGQNPLRLRDFRQITGVGDTVAVAEQRTFAPLFPSYRSPMADLLGLRFIALGVPAEQIDKRLEPGDLTLVRRTKDAFVYENPRALPRVMVVASARRADFAELIRAGWPEDANPREQLLLDQAPPLEERARRPGTATIHRYGNNEIVIEAAATDGGYLLLNDVWHPWWRASLDGKPTEILKANVMFRAVALPHGKHIVRFTFHPFRGAAEQLGLI